LFKPRLNKYRPITAGLHVELGPDGPATINLVVGGAKKKVEFPLAALLHLEDEDRESGSNKDMVELDIDPLTIDFPANKFVTEQERTIHDRFAISRGDILRKQDLDLVGGSQ
jgi:hypothetical protein